MEDLCSVVISLYNKENYIKRAILSVINQTMPFFELIIVDDGSNDNSYEVARSIKDDRIKIVRQSNQGECAARNRGVLEASQDLIAFLDADDQWKPDFLHHIFTLIGRYPDCGVYGTFCEVHDSSGVRQLPNLGHLELGWHGILDHYFRLIYDGFPFNSSSVVIRKKFLKLVDGFPEGVHLGGDIVTWFRLYLVTKFAYIYLPLSIIHFDAENRMTKTNKKPLSDYPPVMTLSNLVRSGALSPMDTQDAINFLAKKQIPVAKRYLELGEAINAREALYMCRGTTRDAKAWKRYYFYSFLPSLIGRLVVQNGHSQKIKNR